MGQRGNRHLISVLLVDLLLIDSLLVSKKVNNGGDMNLKRFAYLGLLITALIVSACGPQATPEPTAKPVPPTDTPAPTATTEVLIPSISGEKVPMGFTEEGLPYRGYPDAPVTLEEHSEFQ
jgi:hypothetical protein